MMRAQRLCTTLVVLALLAGYAGVAADNTSRIELEVVNTDDCPIQILERKTRVGGTLDRDPWVELRGQPHVEREYGPGESQLAFHIGFKNAAGRDVDAVAFVWRAFDASEQLIYERISTSGSDPLEPGQMRTLHEQDVDRSNGIARYRLSVLQANFTDGSVWTAPPTAMRNR